jgi:hypothetical protein
MHVVSHSAGELDGEGANSFQTVPLSTLQSSVSPPHQKIIDPLLTDAVRHAWNAQDDAE